MLSRIVRASIFVTAAASLASSGLAQTAGQSGCDGPEYREFDFWVGEWVVENATGGQAGTNRIEQVLDGCAVHENWEGAGGSRGNSYSIYDARTGRWHQTWVDDQGRLLQLDGGLVAGAMVLEGETPGANGSLILHKVSWEAVDGDQVRQLWTISRDDGDTWNTVFDGIYIPAEPRP